MDVIILAGGLGTRLRSSIGNDIPKCMADIAGKPFLWYLLSYLTRFNVSKVILSVGHLRHVIIDWIDEHGHEFPFGFDYAIEEEPLGTGGGIKLAMSKCKANDIVILNGDTFFNIDLDSFIADHKLYPATISLALKPMKDFSRYGRVIVDKNNNEIKDFCEKEYCKEGLINGGIYAINKFSMPWPSENKFSFEKDVLEAYVKSGRILGFEFNDYFIDIGIPEDYERANIEFPKIFL